MQNRQDKFRNVRLVSSYPITHQFKVQDEFVGSTLLNMMSVRFPFHTMEEWEQRIQKGRVGINGEPASPEQKLIKSDLVFHHNPEVVEPSVPDEVLVLEETEDWVCVYKPSPMPMHPGGRYNLNTLTEILKEQGHEDLRIVHRLDAVTSGLVLFAKTKTFARKAMECFRSGKVKKLYLAEVTGLPPEDESIIESPIRRKTGFVFEAGANLEGAKSAETRFRVHSRDNESNTSIIECEPITGRTHQIRLHLEEWGYPIHDDQIYGVEGDKSSSKFQARGIQLVNVLLEIEELDIRLKLPAEYYPL